MSLGNMIMEQKYVVKLESETAWGLSHGIVNGTLRVYTDGVVFVSNDSLADKLANFGFGTTITDVPGGSLVIPIAKIKSAQKNSFRAVFMQHSLHINLHDGLVLMFRMQPEQADRLSHAINKLISA